MENSEPALDLLGRRKLAQNAVFNVYLDHVAERGGAEVPAYLVVEPLRRTADLVAGVSVLPRLDGKLGLLRVYRHPLGRFVWELPRGFIDAGESDEAAASRELEEETGLAAGAGGLRSLGFFAPEAGLLAARVHLFLAAECARKRAYAAAEMGHRRLAWFSPAELKNMVEAGEIEDPSAIIALFRGGILAEA